MNTKNFSYDFSLEFDNHLYIEYNSGLKTFLRLRVTVKYVIDNRNFWIENKHQYLHYVHMLEWLKENHLELLI